MAYQSFDGEKADSNSAEKLARIRLPEDLTGKSLLDIGCNEGFFCNTAVKRGATRVVGIDLNEKIIEAAKPRTPEAEFLVASWWNLPFGQFDYILFLSAIHYEPNQKLLLELIRTRLRPGGTLILECGVVWDLDLKVWRVIQRHDGMLKFPTARLLMEDLLEGYAVRDMGRSIDQSGDPMSRYVFHCTPAAPTIFVVGGDSKVGKTTFTRMLRRRGVRTIHTDFLLGTWKENKAEFRDPFVQYVREKLEPGKIHEFFKGVAADGKAEQYCTMLLRYVSKTDDMTVIEGFAFSLPEVQQALKRQATAGGYRTVFATL